VGAAFGLHDRPVRQWDILLFPFREGLPHPAVIISNDERCENGDFGRRQRADLHERPAAATEEN